MTRTKSLDKRAGPAATTTGTTCRDRYPHRKFGITKSWCQPMKACQAPIKTSQCCVKQWHKEDKQWHIIVAKIYKYSKSPSNTIILSILSKLKSVSMFYTFAKFSENQYSILKLSEKWYFILSKFLSTLSNKNIIILNLLRLKFTKSRLNPVLPPLRV